MPVDLITKAETARQNGAKSKGPTTPAGKERCRQAAAKAAARRAVAITLDCTLLPSESREILESINAQELAWWQPVTPTELQMVHELIDINWRIKRIRFAQTNDIVANMESQRLRASTSQLAPIMAAHAEAAGSVPGGTQLNLDRRIALLSACRSRLIRDLERLTKRFPPRGGSKTPLKTEHLPIEISWKVPASAPKEAPEADPTTPVADPPNTDKNEPASLPNGQANVAFEPGVHQVTRHPGLAAAAPPPACASP
jgi:hypothetical protein